MGGVKIAYLQGFFAFLSFTRAGTELHKSCTAVY